jgi:hypothetical protein
VKIVTKKTAKVTKKVSKIDKDGGKLEDLYRYLN